MNGFVYIWRHKTDGRYYIGSHQGHIKDGYISSSTVLNNEDLDDWERTILEMGPIDEMRILEETLLKELDAINDPFSLNQANGAGSKFVFKEIKRKLTVERTKEVEHLLTLVGEIK
jgi:hypothetical protein